MLAIGSKKTIANFFVCGFSCYRRLGASPCASRSLRSPSRELKNRESESSLLLTYEKSSPRKTSQKPGNSLQIEEPCRAKTLWNVKFFNRVSYIW